MMFKCQKPFSITLIKIMRDQHYHRAVWEAAGSPQEVWNQSLYIQPDCFSVQSHTMVQLKGGA